VVVIKQQDEGTKEHGFPYVVAAGIERYPLKVTKGMGAKKLARRSRVKPFIKVRVAECGYRAVMLTGPGDQLQPPVPDPLRA